MNLKRVTQFQKWSIYLFLDYYQNFTGKEKLGPNFFTPLSNISKLVIKALETSQMFFRPEEYSGPSQISKIMFFVKIAESR